MNQSQSSYFKNAVPAAVACMRATGVPASVTLAQGILESGWGQSQLAREYNNFFGIKAAHLSMPSSYAELPTTEVVHGKTLHELQPFQKYATATDGYVAHGLLLCKAVRYRPAMAVKGDPEKFCVQLKQCGYSTLPTYPARLMELIREFDLTQYDSPEPEPTAQAKEAA